jgi:cathepsin B
MLKRMEHSVNSAPHATWRAGHNPYWDNWSVEEVKRMLAANKASPLRRSMPVLTNKWSALDIARLPAEFDPRTHNATANCLGPILDQGKCGACWAFGAACAISDRWCLATGNFVQLAPLDLLTCDNSDNGCQGGDPASAWNYAQSSGLVTEPCYPYLTSAGGPIPTCAPADEPCMPNTFVQTPQCTSSCVNGADWSGDKKNVVTSVYSVQGLSQIQAEITNSGPVEVAFDVFQDFLGYKSGVYSHQSGSMLGGHAVKMVGYGTLDGQDYWLCQNSWTTTWGDQGFFKIARGNDECGIEDGVVAGAVSH